MKLEDIMKAVAKLKASEIPPKKCRGCGTPFYLFILGYFFTSQDVEYCAECSRKNRG